MVRFEEESNLGRTKFNVSEKKTKQTNKNQKHLAIVKNKNTWQL